MWRKLSNLPRHEHNHAFLLKHFGNTDIIRSWFDRTNGFDSYYHCDDNANGFCRRRKCELPDGKIVVVCEGDSPVCKDLTVSKNDLRLHTTSLKRLASSLTDLTSEASLFADIQTTGEMVSCIRIGHYMPRGTIRFPVFFGLPIYDGELDAVINYLLSLDKPAIMLLPSIEDIPQAKLNAVKSKDSLLIGLQDLQGDSSLIDIAKVDKAFKLFFKAQKDPDPKINCKMFPTPPGATWGKFIFEWQEEQLLNDARTKKEHKREILMVTCGNKTIRYEPDDLNMLDQRSKTQNKQWALLGIFIKNNGILDWKNSEAKDTLKKQKQELIKKLKKAFYQTDDPIQWDDDEKCYKCKFVCRHDQENQ